MLLQEFLIRSVLGTKVGEKACFSLRPFILLSMYILGTVGKILQRVEIGSTILDTELYKFRIIEC